MNQMQNLDAANQQAADALETSHTTCNNVYTSVDAARDTLRGSWAGGAANKYFEALALWLEELRIITNEMNNMIGNYGGTVQQMHAVEDENIVQASSWNNVLNPN
ncbi:WXG100 family type VII secretion target [Marinactinospora thermotolerans]|uniref:Proteins of 100 residues with WXG n=1 Tax=Marinactinospora thermotolerans DSM 45154 TaxID=1122192 RepID=A0A1T4QBV1_9ACTN|nr:WXG100 family type VII secretion target [Marinactinospora thermotolerans]SKA01209.1 Proteins of 100 residues with WXG [Marinactinospora thermotolerans DSM 45154]